MSKEKLQAFAKAVSNSEELQKQYTSIQVETARSTAEKLARLSETAGTPFTAEEYLQAVAELSEQMSPEQLHTVAGGRQEPITYFDPPPVIDVSQPAHFPEFDDGP
jgi:predicted ribosomally synthesized peptide with nif11-like leader